MRYDNIFWVLIAPALASCGCFAFEMSCNFAESWNSHFEEVRRGFEMLGGKANPRAFTYLSPGAGNELCRTDRFSRGTEAQALDEIRVLVSAMLFGMVVLGSGWR